jgi:hypothetical protein
MSMTAETPETATDAAANRASKASSQTNEHFAAGAEKPALRAAGRHNDRLLVEAEQEIAALRARSGELHAAGDDEDHPEIWDRVFALESKIAKMAPGSLSGAAVKLRRLADPLLGIAIGLGNDDDLAIAQVCAIVERLVEQGIDGRVIPGDADETIRTLFRRWVRGHAAAGKIDTSIEAELAYGPAQSRLCDLLDEIADIPASGPIGIAIKAYIERYHRRGPPKNNQHPASLGAYEAFEEDERYVSTHCTTSLLEDIVRFVPELARLASPVIGNRRARQEVDGDPKEITTVWISYLDEDAEMPLSVAHADGAYRRGTDDELAHHLRYHPFNYEHTAPAVLRRILPDQDGELFALFAERRMIQRREGTRAELQENLRQICEAPAITDAGVVQKLRLLVDATYRHGSSVSAVQQRQLLWAALAWLYHPQDDRLPMEVRALDTKELGTSLRAFDKNEPAEGAA